MRSPYWQLLQLETLGPEGDVYAGPAVVERSTAEDLTLYFEAASAADAGAPVVRRAKLSGLDTMPILPVGGKVWLSKDPAGRSPFVPLYQATLSWALSVRDREGGRLLLGAAVNSTSPAAPIALGERTDTCAEHNPACAAQDAQVFYQAVEVRADSPVTIGDNETATVQLDGMDYEARVTARRETSGAGQCAADYYASNAGGVFVYVQAADLSPLLDGLEQGEPPTCRQGNAPSAYAQFALYDIAIGTSYEGPVFYRGREDAAYQPGEFMFDVPGLHADPRIGVPPLLSVFGPPGAIREPRSGEELWVSFPSLDIQALREAGRGPLRLASVNFLSAPFDAPTAALLEQTLGVAVAAEKRCDYVAEYGFGDTPAALWDVVFDTTPPVRARSGELTKVTLDGRDYSVWVWGEKSVYFALYAL